MIVGAVGVARPSAVFAANDTDSAKGNPSSSAASGREAVKTCVDSHLSAQELRQEGKLLESRARLVECSQEHCPELVRGECVRLLEEVRAQVPSVVFRVTVDGETRSEVSAFLGDRKLFSEIPPRAMEFDPGKYRFRFDYGKLPSIERDITIAEGERFLPIAVAFETPNRTPPKQGRPPSGAAPESAPVSVDRRPVPWPVYALAGLGVVGVGGFVGFGLASRSKESDLKSSCSPTCTPKQIDSAHKPAILADISLGVGAAAMVAAATYYLLRPTQSVRVGAVILPTGHLESQLQITF
jgi:hypothetical protein